MPIDLAATVEKVSVMLDQDYSKLYRRGFDLVVIEVYNGGRIDRKTYDEYRAIRHLFRDEDFAGIPDPEVPRPKNVLTKIIESKACITPPAAPPGDLGAA